MLSRAIAARPKGRVLTFMSLLLAACLAAPLGARAADAAPADATADTAQLQQEIQQEQERLKALEQRLAADEAARAAAPAAVAAAPPQNPNAVVAGFGADGFTLSSVDGANVIRFRGNLSVDDRWFSDSYTPTSADTLLIRKLRPTLEGTLANYIDFRFMPDFGQGKTILQDGWADVRIEPWLVFQFGKFKAPVGLERLQLEQFARFIEVSLPSDLLPYRDLGFKVGGNFGAGLLSYDVGIFDGTLDGGSTDGNSVPDEDSTGKFTWDARVFSKPFSRTDVAALRGFGVGIAGTYVNVTGIVTPSATTSLLASYKTPGQQSMFSYRADTLTGASTYNNATIAAGIERRLTPQFYYYYRSFGLIGEYVHEAQQVERRLTAADARAATLINYGWEVQGAWFITGEDEGYDTAAPRHEFRPGGGVGGWEVVARYHEIHFDSAAFSDGANSFANPATSPGAAHAVGTGINWYLTRNFRTQLDYEVTRFDGGALSGNRPDERVLTTQFALIY